MGIREDTGEVFDLNIHSPILHIIYQKLDQKFSVYPITRIKFKTLKNGSQ